MQKVHLDRRVLVEPLSAIIILVPCTAQVPDPILGKRGLHDRKSILPRREDDVLDGGLLQSPEPNLPNQAVHLKTSISVKSCFAGVVTHLGPPVA